jgi:hypothetical protein
MAKLSRFVALFVALAPLALAQQAQRYSEAQDPPWSDCGDSDDHNITTTTTRLLATAQSLDAEPARWATT